MPNQHNTVVLILNYNGIRHLQAYLPGILQATPAEIPVIIADNASGDESLAWLSANYPQLRIIKIARNLGYAGGYNEAIAQVDADNIILLNSDLQVGEFYSEYLIERLESDANIAAVQPKIRSLLQPDAFEYAGAAGGWIDALGYPFCRGRLFDSFERDHGQYDNARAIFWASGAAFIIRKAAFDAAGGFDGRFFAHQEEIDLCYRLQLAGYKIWYEPASVVYHLGGGTLQYDSPRKTFLNLRNNLLMLLKNKPAATLFWLIPLRLILDGIAGAKFLLDRKPAHCMAILKAHFAFYGSLGYGLACRRKAKRQVPEKDLAGRYAGSVVWQYFVKGIRNFNKLPRIQS